MGDTSIFKVTSTAKDPIEDTKARIRKFWEDQGRPNIQKIVNSIEINGKTYEFLMMNLGNDIEIIIK